MITERVLNSAGPRRRQKIAKTFELARIDNIV